MDVQHQENLPWMRDGCQIRCPGSSRNLPYATAPENIKMHPNKANFLEGLSIVMKRWTALQLAVEMQWGGHNAAEKAKDFEESLADYFEKGFEFYYIKIILKIIIIEGKKLEPEDIEEILYDVMRDEFGAILEDESEIEVS